MKDLATVCLSTVYLVNCWNDHTGCNRAVPVLATLILLSYNKLHRTSINILDSSLLKIYQSETNTTSSVVIVWSVDGTRLNISNILASYSSLQHF